MELLTSKKFKLPTLYFLTNREEIKELPIGVPFIMGNERDKEYFIQLLEWEVLYQKAVQTGLPFNREKILKDNGYNPVYGPQGHPVFFDYKESDVDYESIEADIIDAIKMHNEEATGMERTTEFQHALAAGETITGLIYATALVYPDKKIKDVKTKSVTKRMKQSAFAASVSRENIMECEKIGIPLNEFADIALNAMKEISDKIGL